MCHLLLAYLYLTRENFVVRDLVIIIIPYKVKHRLFTIVSMVKSQGHCPSSLYERGIMGL